MTNADNPRQWLRPFLCGAITTFLLSVAAVAIGLYQFRNELLRDVPAQRSKPGTEIHTGAWGQLEALRIPLINPNAEPPDAERRFGAPQWFFEGICEQQLTNFFNSCSLTEVQRTALLDRHNWTITTNGCTVAPPPSLVRSLSSAARQSIYAVLAKSAANFPQCHPFRFPIDGFERCLAASGISSASIAVLKPLTYREGASLCFSDLQAAKELLSSAAFQQLVETLYEVPVYRLRLRVEPQSDIDALVHYWGVGGRSNLIRPLLTSLTRVPEGTTVSILHLLPSFPAMRLYTFPTGWNDAETSAQDCFFTALNFFNDKPDTNFHSFQHVQRVLASEYSSVGTNTLYGDLVLLLDPAGNAMHAAVYIADDFVFTKNGVSPSQPWALMKMSEMLLLYYGAGSPGHMLILRRNDLRPPPAPKAA